MVRHQGAIKGPLKEVTPTIQLADYFILSTNPPTHLQSPLFRFSSGEVQRDAVANADFSTQANATTPTLSTKQTVIIKIELTILYTNRQLEALHVG